MSSPNAPEHSGHVVDDFIEVEAPGLHELAAGRKRATGGCSGPVGWVICGGAAGGTVRLSSPSRGRDGRGLQLKSWATLLRWPMASIFWDWRNCSSRCRGPGRPAAFGNIRRTCGLLGFPADAHLVLYRPALRVESFRTRNAGFPFDQGLELVLDWLPSRGGRTDSDAQQLLPREAVELAGTDLMLQHAAPARSSTKMDRASPGTSPGNAARSQQRARRARDSNAPPQWSASVCRRLKSWSL